MELRRPYVSLDRDSVQRDRGGSADGVQLGPVEPDRRNGHGDLLERFGTAHRVWRRASRGPTAPAHRDGSSRNHSGGADADGRGLFAGRGSRDDRNAGGGLRGPAARSADRRRFDQDADHGRPVRRAGEGVGNVDGLGGGVCRNQRQLGVDSHRQGRPVPLDCGRHECDGVRRHRPRRRE